MHPKFKTLRSKYGWEGEGKFWALNNMIAQAEECWLDLNREYNRGSIASDLNFTIDEFNAFVKYLANDCKLLIAKKGKVTTENVQEGYALVAGNREKARYRKVRREVSEIGTSSDENMESSDEQNNKKDKIKKEKNKKDIHEIYFEKIIGFEKLNNDDFHKIYFMWIQYRNEIKKPLKSATVIQQQLKFLNEQKDPAAVINRSIQNQWQGLFEIKTNENEQTKITKYRDSPDKKRSRIERNLKAASELVQRVTSE